MGKKVVFLLIFCLLNTVIVHSADLFINKIEVDKSQILTEDEIQDIITKYEGKNVDLKDLQKMIEKINELYIKKSYITAKAILPAQEINNGIIRIKLVEGRVGHIYIENNQYTRDSFLMDRISLKPGDLVGISSLEKDLLYFNNTNDVQLMAKLKAGEKFATTDLVFKVQEPVNSQMNLFYDNRGRSETGKQRTGLTVSNKSLFGYRDMFNMSVVYAEGTVAGVISYNIPLNKIGTRFNIAYNKNQTDIISGSFKNINIEGDFSDLNISIRHPITIKPNYKAYGSLELHHKESNNLFSGVKLLTQEIQNVLLGFSSRSIDERGSINIDHSLNYGFNQSESNKNFIKYNGAVTRQKRLSNKSIFQLRALVQLTGDKLLPSADQFPLGGASTVRGYSEGKITGDKGYLLSVQVMDTLNEKITGFAFLDHGGAFPFKGNDQGINSDDFITSIGLGAKFNVNKNVSGEIIYGIPLGNDDQPQLHFLTQYKF